MEEDQRSGLQVMHRTRNAIGSMERAHLNLPVGRVPGTGPCRNAFVWLGIFVAPMVTSEVKNSRGNANGDLEQERPMENKTPDPPATGRGNGQEIETVIGKRVKPPYASEWRVEQQMEKDAPGKRGSD
jgi:hypothetical protein